jgi:hypothetical protein
MQWSTDIHQIKAAIWNQAFTGRAYVVCPMGRVVAIRRKKGQLLAMIYGWGRWYPVSSVTIEMKFAWPCSYKSKVRAMFADCFTFPERTPTLLPEDVPEEDFPDTENILL